MVVASSSDDAVVNDVLYAPNGYADPVCITYGAVWPATQFTPPNTLARLQSRQRLRIVSSWQVQVAGV